MPVIQVLPLEPWGEEPNNADEAENDEDQLAMPVMHPHPLSPS